MEVKRDNENITTVYQELSTFELSELTRLYNHLAECTRHFFISYCITIWFLNPRRPSKLSPTSLDKAEKTLSNLQNKIASFVFLSVKPPLKPDTHGKIRILVFWNYFLLHFAVFSLYFFTNIQEIILNSCPPTTISDLSILSHKLKRLEIINSGIYELQQVFLPRNEQRFPNFQPMMMLASHEHRTPDEKWVWNLLSLLRITNCGIIKLDSSLHYITQLSQLDLSHNKIVHLVHLYDCPNLKILNISFNRIRVLSNLIHVIPNICKLNLAYNNIESLDGLSNLLHLSKLDLSHNVIQDFNELQEISGLKSLSEVFLFGNPLEERPNYSTN